MQRSSILITGGGGFIGSHIAAAVVAAGHRVVILEQREVVEPPSEAHVVCGDITEAGTWASIPPCDVVFHAAGFTSAVESEQNPDGSYRTNVEGTQCVAAYARLHGARVIFCSSIRVYDPDAVAEAMERRGVVNEDCALVRPDRTDQPPFTHHKRAAEQILINANAYTGGVIIHRMSSVVGPGQRGREGHGWVAYLVQCAIDGRPYTIFGDGAQIRDPLHIDDLVQLVRMELTDWPQFSRPGGAIYNVGGGPRMALSVNDVIRILREDHGLTLRWEHGAERSGEPRHYIADTTAVEQCGWSRRHEDSRDLIRDIVASHRSDAL
ncbi:MAG: NAD-dependent epimerase/dehydratase family protein [bacterium]|nr:NAD-dependent epimerase/dehydratase family protein [bacterium]